MEYNEPFDPAAGKPVEICETPEKKAAWREYMEKVMAQTR